MKRFGKVFLINILPRIVVAVGVTVALTYLFTYIDQTNAATLAYNAKAVAEQQASVDKFTATIKTSIAGIKTIQATYIAEGDLPTKNVMTYDLVTHEANCTTLVNQYNQYVATLPSYIKFEIFETHDCVIN